jgi:uncharacterized membrane protein YedE/YeeE
MPRIALALVAGTIFGVGLFVSQMTNPAKVLGFLDVAGHWDPSLALVMGGALCVTFPAFAWARRRSTPWLASSFSLPTRTDLDGRLIGGAAVFGAGWGMAGFCPGPALASLGFAEPATYPFVAAMLVGVLFVRGLDAQRRREPVLGQRTSEAS